MSQELDRSAPPASTSRAAGDVKLPGWKPEQVKKAVQSLLKYVGQRKEKTNALFDDEEVFYMQLALKKMPMQPRKDKPVPLPIPHPLYTTDGQEICLFVKDTPDGQGGKEAKKKLAKLEKNGGVAKVIGTTKLRTKYESYEAKRKLCKSFDLFLADDRILPSLPKLIGKSFFKKKKQPVPINLRKANWAAEIKKACACTYLFKGTGTSVNIKVGLSSFSTKQVQENILAALCAAVEHIPKKWSNIQGVFLKTPDSVALPLYQTLPDQPQKI
ncbi:hypothetical protein VOLCADRAFT_82719 [Volvox carteri f. nagariensis]|uniref:Ribosomal protein L1 n=1 Tax=Volvox carteri f. nagariensis TaxID=3068 RepID=D8U6I4_VOLCA|nr:uncharacterized protein VOLCADRAFT_82719 [Volvox carteri f. nagariensis]EFJ44720.1 hypothetical protein VOLCADRAFT_82719 [Volvox carteri f. nagariensis]|eukprot:XP_002954296.1 hypothetical protein VOLCADRAFT_82719 [Volvox carteri f. nagariensis]